MHDDLTYLGIDVGVSGLRTLLISGAGKPMSATEAYYVMQNLYVGWSEQVPDKWIVALNSRIHELKLEHAEFSRLNGIGVAGHTYGACLLDKTRSVIRPFILWNDTRSHLEARVLGQLKFLVKFHPINFLGLYFVETSLDTKE